MSWIMISKKRDIKKNILVIDPDEDFTRDVCLFLEENYNVITKQSIDYLDYTIVLKKIDLLILEAELADKNFLDLLAQLKQNHPRLKIMIMYTYFSSDPDIEHALAKDADDMISKPFDVAFLKSKVDTLLESYNPNRIKTNHRI